MTEPSSNPAKPPEAASKPNRGGDDALCFTAGIKGAPFGAGVIHAYLAADRKPPLVAAGISMGALTAAAMQHCYRDLLRSEDRASSPPEVESQRWHWLRRYCNRLTAAGPEMLWRSFPDPIDYFADRPPVTDLSVPKPLKKKEEAARRQYFLLTKLWRWLARLPIKASTVATAGVRYVRYKERYGGWPFLRWLAFAESRCRIAISLYRHIVLCPQFVYERQFLRPAERPPVPRSPRRRSRQRSDEVPRRLVSGWVRPLFGWWIWLGTLLPPLAVAVLGIGLGARALGLLDQAPRLVWQPFLWAAGVVVALAVLFTALILLSKALRTTASVRFLAHLGRQLQIQGGLLSDYQLHRFLFELFAARSAEEEPRLEEEPFPVLLVASPLQDLSAHKGLGVLSQQVIARTGTLLVTALRASLAAPPFLPPVVARQKPGEEGGPRPEDWLWGVDGAELPRRLDLVDGAVVRRNPIPAFFWYLRHKGSEAQPGNGRPSLSGDELGERLSGKTPADCRLHVVYSLPITPLEGEAAVRADLLDVVDVTRISFDLAQRRDTKLEVRQTYFVSRLEHEIRRLDPKQASKKLFPVFPDEIAPEDEIRFKNALAPTRKEFFSAVAAGCRSTLERLYATELGALPRVKEEQPSNAPERVHCHLLLAKVAPRRADYVADAAPGMTDACRQCTRKLAVHGKRDEIAAGYEKSFGLGKTEPSKRDGRIAAEFGHLIPRPGDERPRIAFLASGGVFRGATHIGVLGALRSQQIRPDLVVGASVGSMIGGALAAASVLPDAEANQLLAHLAESFLRVDRKVALTRTLKNAAKQLGIRAREVDFSPDHLRRLIEAGTRSDPGYAAVGAPPALIDALSQLFLMPHSTTMRIAAEFVAGHYTRAAGHFWRAVQRETLDRLDIRQSVMGVSLLKPTARRLLGDGLSAVDGQAIDLDRCQPFHLPSPHPRVSLFATATKLDTKSLILLGRDFPAGATRLNFLNAVLGSGAFPAAFAPQPESSIFPGLGKSDVLFSDGGMFDNLPFFPALDMLAELQRTWSRERQARHGAEPFSTEYLVQRAKSPYLFIAGALDATPLDGGSYDDLLSVRRRATKLKKNLKIESFEKVADLIDSLVTRLTSLARSGRSADAKFLDGIVHAGVLKIVPTDEAHLNPTFAFSATTGFEKKRVQRAIADGCHQTLKALADAQAGVDSIPKVTMRSVRALSEAGKIPWIASRSPLGIFNQRRSCPYFLRAPGGRIAESFDVFPCPFATAQPSPGLEDTSAVVGIYDVCARNPAYRRNAGQGAKPPARAKA